MCVLAATPLSIHFFLKPHLRELACRFEVTLACNFKSDVHVTPLGLPVREVCVGIERKTAPWRDLLALFSLCQLFARDRFDIVVTIVPKAGLLGMLAAFLFRVPHRVHIFQGEVWASRRGPLRFFLKWVDVFTARLASHVLTVSASEQRFLEQELVVRTGKVQVLGAGSICGVDTEKFRPDAALRNKVRAELEIPEQAVVCIFLGRLTLDKGVLDLAKAFVLSAASRTDLWLLFAGPDEEQMEDRLRELVPPQLKDRVRILGFTKNPERQLAAADFLCLPSYREGFGMAILEAAAVGIPAVGTKIYGITDAIKDGLTGRLVPVGDIEELSKVLTLFCELPEARLKYGMAALSRVKSEFEQRNVVEGYVRYFCDNFLDKSNSC
jgi:glycosyltransferase involved in cell wall biosynthesis